MENKTKRLPDEKPLYFLNQQVINLFSSCKWFYSKRKQNA